MSEILGSLALTRFDDAQLAGSAPVKTEVGFIGLGRWVLSSRKRPNWVQASCRRLAEATICCACWQSGLRRPQPARHKQYRQRDLIVRK
jgi:hypothetical protein